MAKYSTRDPEFRQMLAQWLEAQGEVLLEFAYSHSAGLKEFEFFHSKPALVERLDNLRQRTLVSAYRGIRLPIRGVVDDLFIDRCLQAIPDGTEYLIVETEKRSYGSKSWFHYYASDSLAELPSGLEGSRGKPVAFGVYPEWDRPDDEVIAAIVPNEHGAVIPGVY